MLLLRLRSTFIQCCSRDSQHRPHPQAPRFDEASDIELAQMSEPRINLDKCQRECLHYGCSLDGEDGTGGSLARRQCGASFVFATSKYGIACVCFVPYRKPTLRLRVSGITRQLLFSYAAAFHPSSTRTQRMSDSIPRHRGQVHLMLLHFITGCCIGAFYRTHSWQTESLHCLYLAAPSCRSCYPLRYPCPCLRYCVPFAIALPRLAPSFTDVLPYRLLLLHLNSRLHARRQYRTSVTLMMALHDVARHAVPSSIKIGTREYKILCTETLRDSPRRFFAHARQHLTAHIPLGNLGHFLKSVRGRSGGGQCQTRRKNFFP